MKTKLLISILVICTYIVFSQTKQDPYVSELFDLSKFTAIDCFENQQTKNQFLSCTDQNNIYFIDQLGLNLTKFEQYATIFVTELSSGAQKQLLLPVPEFVRKGKNSQMGIWIWAFAISKTHLIIAIDELILIYKIDETDTIIYERKIDKDNIDELHILNDNLHAFEYDNDMGYIWYKYDMETLHETKVRNLEMDAHFFFQIGPRRIIDIRDNILYFVQQAIPRVDTYNLAGDFLTSYQIPFQNWRAIPIDIKSKLNELKDISERSSYFSKYKLSDFNFVNLFYVFSQNRFLIFIMDKNEVAKSYFTPYLVQIVGDNFIIEPYTLKLKDDVVFENGLFPFPIEKDRHNLVYKRVEDKLISIDAGTTVEWENKSKKKYDTDVDLFHKDCESQTIFQLLELKNSTFNLDAIQFTDFDNTPFFLSNIKKDKAIFLISKDPQCSACIKSLWNWASSITFENVEIVNVSNNCLTYLDRREKAKEINQYLKIPYTLLFLNVTPDSEVMKMLVNQVASPVVMFYNKRKSDIQVISTMRLFDPILNTFSQLFIKRAADFLQDN